MFDFEYLDRFMPGLLEMLLPRASTSALEIDVLFDIITILVGFWFVLVFAYFMYLIFRYRRLSDDQKAQYVTGETHKQKQAVEVPHYLILVCDLVVIVFTFIVWYNVKIDLPEPDEEVLIVAQQWAWTFHHEGPDGVLRTDDDIIKVNELHVKKDTVYTYYLEATDVMHSFSVPVFRLKQDAIPGRVISGWFEPNKTGEWDIQCAEMCGVAHGIMGARIHIHTDEEYSQWVAANAPEGHFKTVASALQNNESETEVENNG